MKKYFLYPLMALLAGCSTGPYLYPESTTGKNAVLDRTCPGPKAAMSFAPLSEELNWVHVLVYVAPPGTSSWPGNLRSVDTELRLFGRLYIPPRLRNLNTPDQRRAAYKQTDPPLWVSAASPLVSVTLATGETYQVSMGMRTKTWTGYAAKPRLSRYSMGLSAPREIFIRFSLYQRMYESKA